MKMEFLCNQVLACVPLKSLVWDNIDFSESSQNVIIQKIFKNPLVQKYPPSTKYSLSFLKNLMQKIEDHDCEVHGDVYELLASMMSKNSTHSEYSYRSYYLGDSIQTYITLKESMNLISAGTTGLHTWQAAFCLAEWAIENCKVFRNKSVVEIGSGCGFLGLVVSNVTGPSSYTFTDCHEDVLALLQENIRINNSEKSNYQERLLVKQWNLFDETPVFKCDILLGSDIVYDNDLTDALVVVLKEMIKNNPTALVLIACTIRNSETLKHFKDKAVSANIKVSECQLPVNQVFFYDKNSEIIILKLSSDNK